MARAAELAARTRTQESTLLGELVAQIADLELKLKDLGVNVVRVYAKYDGNGDKAVFSTNFDVIEEEDLVDADVTLDHFMLDVNREISVWWHNQHQNHDEDLVYVTRPKKDEESD